MYDATAVNAPPIINVSPNAVRPSERSIPTVLRSSPSTPSIRGDGPIQSVLELAGQSHRPRSVRRAHTHRSSQGQTTKTNATPPDRPGATPAGAKVTRKSHGRTGFRGWSSCGHEVGEGRDRAGERSATRDPVDWIVEQMDTIPWSRPKMR